VDSALVWACCDRSQIPEEAIGLQGSISGIGLGGREVKVEHSGEPDYLSYVLLSGIDAEKVASEEEVSCSLSSITLSVSRAGHCWRSKAVSPLAERAQELGGCELLRLFECPVAIGFFDPTLQVTHHSAPPFDFPVKDFGTCLALKEELQKRLSVPLAELAVLRDGVQLGNDAVLAPGQVLQAAEMAMLRLRAVLGCCEEPLEGAAVILDGQNAGSTDAAGVFSFQMTVGRHELCLQHSLLGQHGRAVREADVQRGQVNDLLVAVDARLFAFFTDPEEEEEVAEDECPLYDPSCVWLAADPAHIPDDAKPLSGCVACPDGCGCLLRVKLSPNRILPFEMGRCTSTNVALAQQDASGKAKVSCLFGGLLLNCRREDFTWKPKDPSPLAERLAELGGCELLRLIESGCPVALGFLKPAVTVHTLGDRRFVLPLDACGEVSELRSRLAEELGETDVSGTSLELVEAENKKPLTCKFLKGPMQLLCARPGQALKDINMPPIADDAQELPPALEPGTPGEGGVRYLELEA